MQAVYYVPILLPQEGEGDGPNVSSLCAPSLLIYVANHYLSEKRISCVFYDNQDASFSIKM